MPLYRVQRGAVDLEGGEFIIAGVDGRDEGVAPQTDLHDSLVAAGILLVIDPDADPVEQERSLPLNLTVTGDPPAGAGLRYDADDEVWRASRSDRAVAPMVPSLARWTKVKRLLSTSAGTWKTTWAGYGIWVGWDHDTGRLAMFYGGYRASTGIAQVGLAYSDDGVEWTDYGSNPVFGPNPTPGQGDDGSVGFLTPIWDEDDQLWHGYYIGWPETGIETGTPAIFRATAPTLTTPSASWTRHGEAITVDDFPDSENIAYLYRPNVFELDGTWYCFTNAGPIPYASAEHVYYFTAPAKTGPWTYGGKALDASAFGGGNVASDPQVVPYGDRLLMVLWTPRGLEVAHCDRGSFPEGWEAPAAAALPVTGGLYRPFWVTLPSGAPALYVNANFSTAVDLYMPASAVNPGAQPSKWHEVVLFSAPPFASTGTWQVAFNATCMGNLNCVNLSHAQNDARSFVVDLSAGTWSLNVWYAAFNLGAIATVDISFDGGATYQTIGTFDTYAASGTVAAAVAAFTGISVPRSGPAILRFRALTKNASNATANYYMGLSLADFTRTA